MRRLVAGVEKLATISVMQKKILITGATSGIGLATCRKFIKSFKEDHLSFMLIGRRLERLAGIKQELSDQAQINIIELDVREQAAIELFIEENRDWLSKIDILVNNAGLAAGSENIPKARLDDWNQMIDTNVKGLVIMTHHILPFMIERKEGHIFNIGSIAGIEAYPGGSVYCASKAAVHSFHQTLRMETVGQGIRATLIAPGMAETEFSLVRYKGDEKKADAVYKGIKPLTADDIAETIVWAASQPRHVNIQELLIMPTNQASPYHVHRD